MKQLRITALACAGVVAVAAAQGSDGGTDLFGPFWQRVERARSVGNEQAEQLRTQLRALQPAQVVEFHHVHECLLRAAQTADLYGAMVVMDGEPGSDDRFLYFRNWLIAQGRSVYEGAVAQPDSLAALPTLQAFASWDEDVAYAATAAYGAMTGQHLYEQPTTVVCPLQATGFDPSTAAADLQQRLPRLWERYRH